MRALGHCHVYFAFLAASQVDLDRAEAIARARPTERTRFQRDRRTPAYLDFDPPPLQITLPCEPVPIGVGTLRERGAGGRHRLRLRRLLGGLPRALRRPARRAERAVVPRSTTTSACSRAARRRVDELVETLAPGLPANARGRSTSSTWCSTSPAFEPRVAAVRGCSRSPSCGTRSRSSCARRSDRSPRAASKRRCGSRSPTAPDDLLVVDWSTAVAAGGSADERLVLEFANTELLELRCLDKRLDGDLEAASRALSRPRRRIFGGADLRRVAKLQVDNAMLYESVNNAVSLLGDQWLADVYASSPSATTSTSGSRASPTSSRASRASTRRSRTSRTVRRSELLELIIIASDRARDQLGQPVRRPARDDSRLVRRNAVAPQADSW